MDNSKDGFERRCPMLGGTVSFRYCRTSGADRIPCWKVFDCWWEYFDVVAYLQAALPRDVFEKIAAARPKPKLTTLMEILEQAQKNVAAGSECAPKKGAGSDNQ